MPEVSGLPPLHWLLNRAGSATVDGGALTMVAGKETDWFNPPSDPASPAALANAPALVFTPRAAAWQLSARVHVEHRALFDAATLFVYQSPRDWCKLCFEYSPERRPTIVSNPSPSPTPTPTPAPAPTPNPYPTSTPSPNPMPNQAADDRVGRDARHLRRRQR